MIDLDATFAGMTIANARATWTLPADLPYFAGHFPENPIFPAVGLVDASAFALSRHLGRAVEIASIPSAKFTRVLGPDEPVELELSGAGAEWTVTWTITADRAPVACLTLRLKEEA